jgi:putative Holliday junction resolvase
MSKILGIDYGSKRVGISLSDESETIAFAREVIEGGLQSVKKVIELAALNDVNKIVVGYPLNLKGIMTQQTEEVDKFLAALKEKLPPHISVEIWDERLTSKMAESFVISSGMKKKKRQDKSRLDQLSAVFILQSYLDNKKNSLNRF